jgi:pilus assembly protein CpaB
MNKKALIVLGLALVFGGFTAYSVNRVIKGSGQKFAGEMIKIVVAVNPITMGQRITPEMVKLEDRVKSGLPEGTISDLAKVVNRVSLSEVTIGEAILVSRLAAEGSGVGLQALIPEGMRVMSVKVDEVIGVSGFIAPGSFVDVVATVMDNGMNQSTSRIILQGVKVLASGKEVENGRDGGPVEVRTVSLLVTPDQAEALALASTAGKLQLVMRNSTDSKEVQTAGVTTPKLFGNGAFQQMATPPRPVSYEPVEEPQPKVKKVEPVQVEIPKPKGPTVEVIQGSKREAVAFEN